MDLGTTQGTESLLDILDKAAAQPATLLVGMDSKVVDPTPVPVITSHGRPDHTLPLICHYEKLGLHPEFALYILSRVVPRADKATDAPKLQHGILVFDDKAAKSSCRHDLFPQGWWVERPSKGREVQQQNIELKVRAPDARDDAVHRAQAPDYVDTHILLAVAGDFLASPVRFKGASATE